MGLLVIAMVAIVMCLWVFAQNVARLSTDRGAFDRAQEVAGFERTPARMISISSEDSVRGALRTPVRFRMLIAPT